MRSHRITWLSVACLSVGFGGVASAHKTPFNALGPNSAYFDIKCGTIADPVLDKDDFRHRQVPKCKDIQKGGKNGWIPGMVSVFDGDPDAGGVLLAQEPGPAFVFHHDKEGDVRFFFDGNGDPGAFATEMDAIANAAGPLYVRFERDVGSKMPKILTLTQPLLPMLQDTIAGIQAAALHNHLHQELADEAAARAAADAALQANLNAEEAARIAADGVLQNNLNAEEAARIAADGTLQANITAEENARIAADGVLQNNLNAEEMARIAADGVLQNNINAEGAARLAADVALQGALTNEANQRMAADAALNGAIAAEAGARAAADAGLQAQINTKVSSVGANYPINSSGGTTPVIGLSNCPAGMILKSTGGGWTCANDNAGSASHYSSLWQRDKPCGTGGGGVLTANGPESCSYSCGCFSCNCNWFGCSTCCSSCGASNSFQGYSVN